MRKVDVSIYSAKKIARTIKPEKVNLGELPPIEKSVKKDSRSITKNANRRTPERPYTRTGEHANRRTPERVVVRNSYNFYEDQVQAILRLEAEKTLGIFA
jgi:hypothetical protein